MQYANGYKAVLFDLDGTLRHNVPSGADFFNDKARELGMQISDEIAREAGRWEHYYWASSKELREDSQKFNNDENAFWSNYAHRRLTALGANPAEIEKYAPSIRVHMREKYKAEDWVPPEVHEILPALRDAGFKLGLLSNRRTPFLEQMRELALDNYFEILEIKFIR